jgi:hypothetical protein
MDVVLSPGTRLPGLAPVDGPGHRYGGRGATSWQPRASNPSHDQLRSSEHPFMPLVALLPRQGGRDATML